MPSLKKLRKGLFKTEIDITKHFEGIDEKVYIIMCEPSVSQVQQIREDEKKAADLWCECIIDHSFVDENGNKEKKADIVEFLKSSISIVDDITKQWMSRIPLLKNQAEQKVVESGS